MSLSMVTEFALDTQTRVDVSTPLFCVAWSFVLAIHTFTALFGLGVAFAHLAMSLPAISTNTQLLQIPLHLKFLAGFSYLVVAFLHLTAAARLSARSVHAGQLTFHRTIPEKPRKPSARLHLCRPTLPPRARLIGHRLSRAWWKAFGPDGYVGINGPLFTRALVFRELVEILMQTYQLWSLSMNVSRAWINNFAVVAVVANSISIPAVNVVFHRRETSRRLMHLVVDMNLDFSASVIVPVCVLAPYWMQFDWKNQMYPLHLVLNDVWLANTVGEAHQLLVTSNMDYISSLFPQYSIFACLHIFKRTVCRHPPLPSATSIGSISPAASNNAVPTTMAPIASQDKSLDDPPLNPVMAVEPEGRLIRLVTFCIAACGIIVLTLHLQSKRGSHHELLGCLLYVSPWFASKITCVVLHVSCYRRGIDGSATEISEILDTIERPVLRKLVFMHCPALTVPEDIKGLHGLRGFDIYNSSLINWSVEGPITETSHPLINTVYFGRTNVSSIPLALLHRKLPASLHEIGFFNCSLDMLPENLGDLWEASSINQLSFESTRLASIPASIRSLRLRRVWFTGSRIEELPDDLFVNSRIESLRLSGNPLRRLPNGTVDTTRMNQLLVERTNVTDLPPWTIQWLDRKRGQASGSFFGSPVCDLSHQSDESRRWGACNTSYNSWFGFVPYEIYQAKYPL